DLPLDHRVPRRPDVLRALHQRRQRLRLHPAGRGGADLSREGLAMAERAAGATRVHLVDDNDGFRDSTAWLLETAGFEVESYPSGPAFLESRDDRAPPGTVECLV